MIPTLARHTENIPALRGGIEDVCCSLPRSLVRAVWGLHQRVERMSDGASYFLFVSTSFRWSLGRRISSLKEICLLWKNIYQTVCSAVINVLSNFHALKT
jgi:hypothetical protein